ncbi:type II toxin-antitoxin system RelE/ParE family toxin [Dyella ginsengisoli]|uniref:type II toxin-antitoxin system RelE/ParE family toxin n=1 Tax=Dyella ginsengisoli TaxID=363848 RepID=UPI000349EF60|nr:type II toxin-antitoxin system RelE/ParE family toxin [Dyella ginsengisoli]
MKIRYALSAQKDLQKILRYGLEHWTSTAEAFVLQLRKRLESTLTKHPNAGRKGRAHGTREFVLVGTKHIVVYMPPSELRPAAIVVRVLHGAQQWPLADSGEA